MSFCCSFLLIVFTTGRVAVLEVKDISGMGGWDIEKDYFRLLHRILIIIS